MRLHRFGHRYPALKLRLPIPHLEDDVVPFRPSDRLHSRHCGIGLIGRMGCPVSLRQWRLLTRRRLCPHFPETTPFGGPVSAARLGNPSFARVICYELTPGLFFRRFLLNPVLTAASSCAPGGSGGRGSRCCCAASEPMQPVPLLLSAEDLWWSAVNASPLRRAARDAKREFHLRELRRLCVCRERAGL